MRSLRFFDRFGGLLMALMLGVAGAQAAVTSAGFVQRVQGDMNYNFYKPYTDAQGPGGQLYPMVIFLHGLGGGRTVTAPISGNPGWFFLGNDPANPAFMVAPVSPGEGWWGAYRDNIKAMIQALIVEFPVDPDRIYVTGVSGGGQGTWHMLDEYPEGLAAAIPMFGGELDSAVDVSRFKNVSIWCHHAANDSTVVVGHSDRMIDRLRKAGGTPLYSRYDTGGHSSSQMYTAVLRNWMFAQRRGQPSPPNQPPYVQVSSPTADPVFTTVETLPMTGTAHDGATVNSVSQVKAYNYRGGEVIGTGTSSWSVAAKLRNGGLNQVQIIATGSNFTTRGGNLTFSALVNAYYSNPANDLDGPLVKIVSPTSAATFATADSSINLAGTAGDAVGVTNVKWSNHRGGNGNANGTTAWSANNVPIQDGSNEITVRAFDPTGNAGEAILVVNKGTPTNLPPHVNAGPDQEIYAPALTASLAGTMTDDNFPGTSVSRSWSKVSGPGTVNFNPTGQLNTTATFSQPGVYVLRLTASDGWTAQDEVKVTVYPAPGAVKYAINCAGVAYTAADGTPFIADKHFTGGSGGSIALPIANTPDEGLYIRYRRGTFSYSLPSLPNGSYVVDLFFAAGSNADTFDISIEGTLRLGEFSVYNLAPGTKRAISRRFTVPVSDGTLDIAAAPIFGSTILSAILVRDQGVDNSPPVQPIVAIGCGLSAEYTAQDGTVFQTDRNYVGGSAAGSVVAIPIAGTEDDALYQRYRYGVHGYSIPVANGDYTVTLKFADNASKPGVRVFDVSLEGQKVLANFDIRNEAAANTAVDKTFDVTVGDGEIAILLSNVTGNAKINGIKIVPK